MSATITIMTNLASQASPSVLHALAWSLLHFFWQGTAIAALVAGLVALSRRASLRYWAGVAALVLMLLAPLATFAVYAQAHPPSAIAAEPFARAAGSTAARTSSAKRSVGLSSAAPSPSTLSLDALPWLVEAWLAGVAFFSMRSTAGFFLLERERRRRSAVVSPPVLAMCHRLQRRLGLDRAIAYCECQWLAAPAVIGWFRPVVFLPVSALTGLSEEQLESVVAHELAHIRRLDAFVNLFQVGVETLLFYHPLVWWLNQRIRSEREHCCDEVAVSLCGNAVEYARALTLMEEWRSAPQLAMAANRGPLTERIVRVLGLKTFGAGARGIGVAGSVLCLAAALLAGKALIGMAHPRSARASSATEAQPSSSASPAAQAAAGAKPSPSPRQNSGAASSSGSAFSYIDAMNNSGLGDLTIDQLIALKTQDVTAEYVRGLRELGLRLDVDRVIAMRVQDVTPEYIRQLHASGLTPSEDQLIALKVQGADAGYYRELKEAGIQADADRLIALKVQDVTAEYVREIRAAGLTVTADQVIALKVQDVTPGYLKELHQLGIDPQTDDAIALRVQDVTPEYVRGMQTLGLKPSPSQLIAMRVQDVTPEYVKALQAAGFNVDVDDLIRAKVQDVTPEFIELARKHGFKDLTLQKLIQLRQLEILDSKADL
jgi:beta-lactamase regulating signal transducer with metallopeptidase domain